MSLKKEENKNKFKFRYNYSCAFPTFLSEDANLTFSKFQCFQNNRNRKYAILTQFWDSKVLYCILSSLVPR